MWGSHRLILTHRFRLTFLVVPINVSGSTAMVLAGRFAQNPNAWQSPGSGKIDLREQMMYTGMFEGGFHDV